MGKRGPKKAPTEVKIARGTHRKDRDGDPTLEPKPEQAAAPKPPAHLKASGRAKWSDLAPRLARVGLLSEIDLDALALLCEAFDEKAHCEKVLAKEGEYFTQDNGYVGAHPAISRLHRAIGRIQKLMAAFGMSPSDRSGLRVGSADQAKKQVHTRKRA